MKVLDFTNAPSGMLVKRSDHWFKEHGVKKRVWYGILTGKEFYDKGSHIECFPVIHWEGNVTDSINHPANVVPARRKYRLPETEVYS